MIDPADRSPDLDRNPELRRLAALFERQCRSFRETVGPPSADRRRQMLQRLQDTLLDHADALARAIEADFGYRSAYETRILELFPSLEGIRHARRHLKRWMRGERRAVSIWFKPARARVMMQPLGVIGIIVPWNYPLYLAIGPLTSALAAGNRALLKISEYTPRTGEVLAGALSRVFAEEDVAVVNGGVDVGKAFASLPFDHLLFTGSTPVGCTVMRAASANLTPVTLELGGKSPAIIGPDAVWERAVERILVGKLLNAGQTCIAPDYVLLPTGEEARFVESARAVTARLYPDLPRSRDYTSIIDERQFRRLQEILADARAKGARVEELIARGTQCDVTGRRLCPAVVLNTTPQMSISRQEIFGPLLPLLPYASLDEAIAYVNDRPRPLALYYFGRDRALIQKVLQGTTSGGVTVNDTLLHVAQDNLPFGGIGPSGMGHYHGREGFEALSKKKGVVYQGRFNSPALLNPPYGRLADRLLSIMLRR